MQWRRENPRFGLLMVMILLLENTCAWIPPVYHKLGRAGFSPSKVFLSQGQTGTADDTSFSDSDASAEKRVRKLKKSLKRIGELRTMNYIKLTTEQRQKVHGEAKVLTELQTLVGPSQDVELIRVKLQPGCPNPMPESQTWTPERATARAKAKANERRELELKLGQGLRRGGKDVGKISVRKGDWKCEYCGEVCFSTRQKCFACKMPKS